MSTKLTSEFGLTIDIGTSRLTVRIINLSSAHVINEIIFANPQNDYGLDIITRARYAARSETAARQLTEAVRSIIKIKIKKLLNNIPIDPSHITRTVVVGNSVMHHLFVGYPVASFLKPPYCFYNAEEIKLPAGELGISNDEDGGLTSDTQCYLPPLLHSFIGSDALVVLLASASINDKVSCVVDVGTNTEIILRTNDRIWLTSAPSGPSLEGMAVSNGMPAQRGAIDSVRIDPETYCPSIHVIEECRPKGLCGSGAVSLLSQLLKVGLMNENGSLARNVDSTWLLKENALVKYLIVPASKSIIASNIVLTQKDIRLLQQSKAAIRTCIDLMLKHAQHDVEDVELLYLTGAFGSELDLEAAQAIGMFPLFDHAETIQKLGGASDGAARLLTEDSLGEKIWPLISRMEFLDFMDSTEFDERFAWARLFSQ